MKAGDGKPETAVVVISAKIRGRLEQLQIDGHSLFYFPSAASTAAVTCGESGVTAGSKRSTGFPLRSN